MIWIATIESLLDPHQTLDLFVIPVEEDVETLHSACNTGGRQHRVFCAEDHSRLVILPSDFDKAWRQPTNKHSATHSETWAHRPRHLDLPSDRSDPFASSKATTRFPARVPRWRFVTARLHAFRIKQGARAFGHTDLYASGCYKLTWAVPCSVSCHLCTWTLANKCLFS